MLFAIAALAQPPALVHSEPVQWMAYQADGSLLTRTEQGLTVWSPDGSSRRLMKEATYASHHRQTGHTVVFTRMVDGTLPIPALASLQNGKVVARHPLKGQAFRQQVELSQDGQHAFEMAASYGGSPAHVAIYRMPHLAPVRTLELSCDPLGGWMDDTVHIYCREGGNTVLNELSLEGTIQRVPTIRRPNPDGSTFAFESGTTQLVQPDGNVAWTLPGSFASTAVGETQLAGLVFDGRGPGGTERVSAVAVARRTGKLTVSIPLGEHRGALVALSPDEQTLAVSNGTAVVFHDTQTGRTSSAIHHDGTVRAAAAWGPAIATGDDQGTVLIRDSSGHHSVVRSPHTATTPAGIEVPQVQGLTLGRDRVAITYWDRVEVVDHRGTQKAQWSTLNGAAGSPVEVDIHRIRRHRPARPASASLSPNGQNIAFAQRTNGSANPNQVVVTEVGADSPLATYSFSTDILAIHLRDDGGVLVHAGVELVLLHPKDKANPVRLGVQPTHLLRAEDGTVAFEATPPDRVRKAYLLAPTSDQPDVLPARIRGFKGLTPLNESEWPYLSMRATECAPSSILGPDSTCLQMVDGRPTWVELDNP